MDALLSDEKNIQFPIYTFIFKTNTHFIGAIKRTHGKCTCKKENG